MGAQIVGVGTKVDTGFNADYADLGAFSKSKNIPCHYFENINAPESTKVIRALEPGIIFCFGWNSLLKSEVLNIAPMGVLGHHPAPLPRNRGRHPLIWSIVLGLRESASTFFIMNEGVDSGKIVSQEAFAIRYEDTAADVYERMTQTISRQLERLVPDLISGDYNAVSQNSSQSNVWRKRGLKDGEIDFRMHSEDIYNLVRGLSRPYVGAHIRRNDDLIKVWQTEEIDCDLPNIEPGKVIDKSGITFTVKTLGGAVRIIDHEFGIVPSVGEYL